MVVNFGLEIFNLYVENYGKFHKGNCFKYALIFNQQNQLQQPFPGRRYDCKDCFYSLLHQIQTILNVCSVDILLAFLSIVTFFIFKKNYFILFYLDEVLF